MRARWISFNPPARISAVDPEHPSTSTASGPPNGSGRGNTAKLTVAHFMYIFPSSSPDRSRPGTPRKLPCRPLHPPPPDPPPARVEHPPPPPPPHPADPAGIAAQVDHKAFAVAAAFHRLLNRLGDQLRVQEHVERDVR